MSTAARLPRRLGLFDSVAIGLGAMIGAGVFSVWAPAARAAGVGLLLGLLVAAVVAFANATSSAQLAAVHPVSGGTYAYGRAELGPWWGFVAGWSFVIGKTASCAAMALTFAVYAAPPGWERGVAILAVAGLTTVNLFGITRTARLSLMLIVMVLAGLAVVVAAGIAAPHPAFSADTALVPGGAYGVLQSAGLLFFAFAGYARIATMGEEVRDPSRTIPRAIGIALAGAVVVYALVAVVVLLTLGVDQTAESAAPLADVATASGWAWAGPIVRVAAAAASLGALLALIAGVARTVLAMAREHDLPHDLAAVQARHRVPHRAEIALGIVVIGLVAVTDLRSAIGFSSFGVLLYYFVANVAAFGQRESARRYPRALQVVGAVGCLVLAFTLPWQAVAAGVGIVGVGIAGRVIRLRLSRGV